MVIWETLAIAFSMFSAVPMPQVPWNEKNMRYALCAFPLVGALIGALCWLWVRLCGLLSLPAVLRGVGLCLLPVLLTGGIHLDGFADTCDALACHGDREQKQQILKDPHLGAFAAIGLCVYFLASFGFWTALPVFPGAAVLLGFCLSRTLSALALCCFPLRPGSGLARSFADAADKRAVKRVLLALLIALIAGLLTCGGWVMLPTAAVVFFAYRRMATGFGGLSGDLAGWFVQTAELWMLIALCLWQYGEALL